MLSMVFTGLGLLLKACGLIQWGEAMLKQAQDRQLGRELQAGADAQATVAADTAANVAKNKVESQSDAATTADLERFARK